MATPKNMFIIGPERATRIFDAGDTAGNGSTVSAALPSMASDVIIWGSLTKPPAGIQRHDHSTPSRIQLTIFGPEPDGEALDLQAAPQRHPVMPIFVDKNRGAEEQQDGEDHINDVQKPHNW